MKLVLAIARRLAQDGAKVWISSRKQDNVTQRIDELRAEGLNVDGMVCHVGEAKQRQVLQGASIRYTVWLYRKGGYKVQIKRFTAFWLSIRSSIRTCLVS